MLQIQPTFTPRMHIPLQFYIIFALGSSKNIYQQWRLKTILGSITLVSPQISQHSDWCVRRFFPAVQCQSDWLLHIHFHAYWIEIDWCHIPLIDLMSTRSTLPSRLRSLNCILCSDNIQSKSRWHAIVEFDDYDYGMERDDELELKSDSPCNCSNYSFLPFNNLAIVCGLKCVKYINEFSPKGYICFRWSHQNCCCSAFQYFPMGIRTFFVHSCDLELLDSRQNMKTPLQKWMSGKA